MRRQFVLDTRTDNLLEELAEGRAGNRSFVVREAIRLYADLENMLEQVEATDGFREMMKLSAADVRAGRTYTQAEVRKRLAKKKA